jgi:hypothetical protein
MPRALWPAVCPGIAVEDEAEIGTAAIGKHAHALCCTLENYRCS